MGKVKIGIIGIGNVGAHVLYTLVLKGLGTEFVLVDTKVEKADADRQDVFDTSMFLSHPVEINIGDFSDLGDCDIIIYSVGQIDKLGDGYTRMSELIFNISAAIENAEKIKESGFSGIFINISNPCDIVTREFANRLGLREGKVFGTGTGLDTARLIALLASRVNIDPRSINAYMLGEHGNSQFSPWSCASINGKPLAEWLEEDAEIQLDYEEIEQAVVGGAWKIYCGKGRTEYGIAMTAARVVEAVIYNENRVLPVSCKVNGEYGENDVFVGVPAIVYKEGVREIIELSLSEQEKRKFHDCCEAIRINVKEAEKIY